MTEKITTLYYYYVKIFKNSFYIVFYVFLWNCGILSLNNLLSSVYIFLKWNNCGI